MLNNDDDRYCTTKCMNKFKKSKEVIYILDEKLAIINIKNFFLQKKKSMQRIK